MKVSTYLDNFNTVKFDTNGGNEIASQTVTSNIKAAEPTKPTKDGYLFDGWYTDGEFTSEYDFDTKVTKNITLYAKWTEIEKEPDNRLSRLSLLLRNGKIRLPMLRKMIGSLKA